MATGAMWRRLRAFTAALTALRPSAVAATENAVRSNGSLRSCEASARLALKTLYQVAHQVATGAPEAQLGALALKASAGEMAIDVTDEVMRACGGAAFSKHLGIERNFRDARASSVMAPTTDVLKDFIGKAMTGLDLFA